MTTIAWDGRRMAADRRMTRGGYLYRTSRKLFEFDAFVFGAVGTASDTIIVAEWLQAGAPGGDKRLKMDEECIWGLYVRRKDRALFHVQGKTVALVPVFDPVDAVGSGGDFALAAMGLGMPAPEAVAYAMRFDVATGNGVDVVDLGDP